MLVSGTRAQTQLKYRPLVPPGKSTGASLNRAPGYCPSFGGSVTFESINNVSVSENLDGTLTIKVDV